jgi:hypothetical protein
MEAFVTMKNARLLALALAFFCAAGCASLVEKGGRVLDGSAFAEKTGARYVQEPGGMEVAESRRRDGEECLVISLPRFPTLRIRASVPDASGVFFLNTLEFLSPGLEGWNEFTLELAGNGVFARTEGGAVFQLAGDLEALDIIQARIRQQDTRVSGEDAIRALRNRRDRIASLSEWMRSQDAPSGFPDPKNFERYWKPRLFPELASSKARPGAWAEAEPDWTGGDPSWNAAYTRRVFPEELWAARDSGALLRDWEEGSAWVYLQYEWEHITEALNAEIRLKKVK